MRSLWFSGSGQNLEPDACLPFSSPLTSESTLCCLEPPTCPGRHHLGPRETPHFSPRAPAPGIPMPGREGSAAGEGPSSVGCGMGGWSCRDVFWSPVPSCVSHCPLLCPSHAASPGQPGIPPQCHGGCRTGPDLSSRHYGKSHSKIPRQGIVLQGGGHEHTVSGEAQWGIGC